MKIETLKDSCTGCFACMNACPVDAISLKETNEGFYFPVIDKTRCVTCSLCDRICPQLTPSEYVSMQKAYFGWALDADLRLSSSSGGMFGILANTFLDDGGVVYGAAFEYNGLLRLECKSTKQTELKQLQKSKYVQNYIGFAFRQIKKDLDTGSPVLFCGTPCQVDGLFRYLRKDYKNLLLCDFVCHGVPSMSLLRLHLDYLNITDVKEIDFRPKKTTWVDDLIIRYGRNKKYDRFWKFDEFFKLFQGYGSLRRSCYQCNYCNGNRMSDITFADFWGVYKYDPSLFDKKGISLLIVNTNKGTQITNSLLKCEKVFFKQLPIENAQYVYERERNAKDSQYDISKRNSFINDVYSIGYRSAVQRRGLQVPKCVIFRYTFKQNIKQLLKRCGIIK